MTEQPRILTSGARRVLSELLGTTDPGGRPASWLEPATVTAVTAAGASDGSALCTVTWRGLVVAVAYLSSYTPVVGHTVQINVQPPALLILGRAIGTP